MEKQEMIMITIKEYEELRKKEKFLDCLYFTGLTDWEGYGNAQKLMDEIFESN